MIRATAKIDAGQIDRMDLDITFRMTVSEWRSIMRGESGICELKMRIARVLGHVTRATEIPVTDPDFLADQS